LFNTNVSRRKKSNFGFKYSKRVPAEVKVLLNRLDEIKAMDKSSLNLQKKELRKEVRAIKAELKSTGNGVYLSVDNYNSYSY
jgi:hypothetical protein